MAEVVEEKEDVLAPADPKHSLIFDNLVSGVMMSAAAQIADDGGEQETKKTIRQKVKAASIGAGPNVQSDVLFQDITVTVKNKKNKLNEQLDIVKNVSGYVKVGGMLSILGPSGCGKSTLLETIANIKKSNLKTKGNMLFNKKKLSDQTRRQLVSFVAQDTCLQGEFTAKETLWFSARLYFGYTSLKSEVIEAKVMKILELVGLEAQQHVRVGDIFFSGLSGGQKKRLSVGIELVSSPSVILLDEPTSGLDSEAALGIMSTLQTLCSYGHTIICSIHQPSSKIFTIMDSVLFMNEGFNVYFGPANQLSSYIQGNISIPCPSSYSIVDFFIALMSTDFEYESEVKELDMEEKDNQEVLHATMKMKLPQIYSDSQTRLDYLKPHLREIITLEKRRAHFSLKFRSSEIAEEEEDDEGEGNKKSCYSCSSAKNAGFIPNVTTLVFRSLLSLWKNPGQLWIRLIMGILLGIVVGLSFLFIGRDFDYVSINARIAVLCGVCSFFAFLTIASIPFIIEERDVFLRERGNGMYSTLAYVVSKGIVIVLSSLLVSILGALLVVNMIALQDFVLIFLAMWALLYSCECFVLAFGAAFNGYETSLAVCIAIFAMFLFTSGFFVLLDQITWPIRWMSYINPFRYSWHACMRAEFGNLNNLDSFVFPNGSVVLDVFQINSEDSPKHYGEDIVTIIGLSGAFLLAMYLALLLRK